MLIFRQKVKSRRYIIYLWWSILDLLIIGNVILLIRDFNFEATLIVNSGIIAYQVWDVINIRTRIPIEIIFDDEENELRLSFRKGYVVKDNLAVKYKDLTYCYRFKVYKRRVPKTLDFFDEGKLFLALRENNDDGWSKQQIKQIMEKLSTICNEVSHKQSVPIKQRV